MEIVKLIGSDVLPDDQKLTLEIARVIRLGFLQQNAFHQEDTCVPMEKQFKMMETILYLYEKSKALINRGMPVSVLKEDNIFERIISIKYDVPNNELDRFDQYKQDIDTFYDKVLEKNLDNRLVLINFYNTANLLCSVIHMKFYDFFIGCVLYPFQNYQRAVYLA